MNNAASSFAKILREHRPVIGTWLGIPHSIVGETISQIGVDFVLADGEHGAVPPHKLLEILPATDRYAMPLVYRVPFNRPEYIKAALDIGVAGVMIPMVNSVEEATAAISTAKYPPGGTRGIGAWRASNYYQDGAGYRARANDETTLIIQIETGDAVRCVDAIAELKGVDVLYLGPGDLAYSMGIEPGLQHPLLIEAYKTVVAAARRNGVKTGIDVTSLDFVNEYVSLGIDFFTFQSDYTFILDGGRRAAASMRDCVRGAFQATIA
ncbi:hypothetical protein N185_17595 [Sinorhizobium sp. GW3]|nr:hypothetical protein N185_17595 [Sinorhizobium sp. GW3]